MDSGDKEQKAKVDGPDLFFVKVNGSKATPMEVNLTDDKVEDVMRRIQKDEDLHVRVLKRSERLRSCEVADG